MTRVTRASIAYVATQVNLGFSLSFYAFLTGVVNSQVRFALSSSPVFSQTDTVTDSERFYTSVLDLLDDVEELGCVNDLLTWWNRYVSIPG